MEVALASHEYGAGPPLLILHGLFGSHGNWASLARKLGERYRVLALDLRNHGGSPWADAMDYPAQAGDVAAFLAAQGIDRAAVIGHSMGGKTAMALALSHPGLVERLVVVDIAPVKGHAMHSVELAAMQGLDLTSVTRRSDADAAMAPAIPDAAVRGFLLQNLVSGPQGFHWRINLGAIAQGFADLGDFPDYPPAARFPNPALLIRGGRSPYVNARGAAAFQALFPKGRVETIAEADHWLHAEKPAEFLALVEPFLAGQS